MQRSQEPLGDRIGFAASEPPRPRRAVEAADRNYIGYAESCEGVTHVTFPIEPAHVGILCRERLDRFASAANGSVQIIGQKRAGDLDFHRLGKNALRQAYARLEREHRVIAGRTSVEHVDWAEFGLKRDGRERSRAFRSRAFKP